MKTAKGKSDNQKVEKYKYQEDFLTGNVKCGTEIRRHVLIDNMHLSKSK